MDDPEAHLNHIGTDALPPKDLPFDPREAGRDLESRSAEDRVAWGLRHFEDRIILTSSFGAQAAVSLHLATSQRPDIPVVLIDTGYLFPETYRFIDELTQRLNLNLNILRSSISAAWQEARYGKLWEQGVEGIEKYNRMNKVEPMNRALKELQAQAWFAGLRRQQSSTRNDLSVLAMAGNIFKIHPIVDWTDHDVYLYLKKHDLPYHPLWHEGFVSIGDIHTTHKLTVGMERESARFFGLKRECGLHENVTTDFSI